MKNVTDFSSKTAVIVCHDAMFGPPHELRDYLLQHHIQTLLFIGHKNRALANNPIRSSYYELYKDGRRVKRFTSKIINLPEALGYIKDACLTFFWSMTVLKEKVDIFIGVGNLNAFAGVILEVLGKVHTIIYYVIDYIPNRFANPLLNRLYHRIDAMCAGHCVTWNYAPAMIRAREQDWKRKFPHQLVVPNGIHVRSEIIQPFLRVRKTEIIYLGTLAKQQGVQLMVKAIPAIVKKIPSVTFSIIGKGVYREALEKLVKKLGVEKYVHFLGFIEDPVAMERRLAQAALGVAMYEPEGGFVQYTEPGKVKRYLAAGVPVVMTDVSPLAREIERKLCGFQCASDAVSLTRVITSFLTDERMMKTYRKNAINFAKDWEWDVIFGKAFATSVK